MIYRLILPDWAKAKNPSLPKVLEGEYTQDQIEDLNAEGYNVYFLPNYPSVYDPNVTVDGRHIDRFEYVFVDMDLKEGKYLSKDAFIETLAQLDLLPSRIVDSGNGVHVYWRITDLDALSFLRLQRRLLRRLNKDVAVAKIYQLMRVVGTLNTKDPDELKPCKLIFDSSSQFTCEQVDKALPPISKEDEDYCIQHYNKTFRIQDELLKVSDAIPQKFNKLIKDNKEVRDLWLGAHEDRSGADFRLGHIMYGNGFSKDEAISVLMNAEKAMQRTPANRLAYARGIVEKIWVFEASEDKNALTLSKSIREILSKGEETLQGTRFPCWSYLDGTDHGFRLGEVIGLVAGSGVGKTTMALNMFLGFAKNNPDYHHFFIPLEQPAKEIAARWHTMCKGDESLEEKVHILSNYDDNGQFRHLSLDEIKEYVLRFQKVTGHKIGCVVIDHIGALKKKGAKNGENQDLMTICHAMKGFAIETNTLLVMQSQSNRQKAGIGDIELDKDAAYGTVYFESYCDYLITIWQPLKRCYDNPACPSVMSFKFCKIRHKNLKTDHIKEDSCYNLYFDPLNEHLRELTQDEEQKVTYFLNQAVNKRKKDKRTDVTAYTSITWTKNGVKDGNSDISKDSQRA